MFIFASKYTPKNNVYLAILILLISKPCFSQSNIFDRLTKNSFKIECFKDTKLSKTGSGFILKKELLRDGTFEYTCLTNEHVIDNTDTAFVVFSEHRFPITGALASLHKLDATVFTFSSNLNMEGLLDNVSFHKVLNYEPEIGSAVFTMSSPKGLLNTLSNGIISQFRKDEHKNLIHISAPISSGSSGGVVINNLGLPIGLIVSQYSEGQNLNFCVPLKDIFKSLMQQYLLDDNFNFKELFFSNLKKLSRLIIKDDLVLNSIEQARAKKDYELMYQLINNTPEDYLTEGFLFLKAGYLGEQKKHFEEFKTTIFFFKKYRSVLGRFTLATITSKAIERNTFDIPINFVNSLYYNNDDIFLDILLRTYLGHYYYFQKKYSQSIDYLNPIISFFEKESEDTAKFTSTEIKFFNLQLISEAGKYYTHHVEIKNLDPNTEYKVLVGDGLMYTLVKDVEEKNIVSTVEIPENVLTPVPAYGTVKDHPEVNSGLPA